MSTRLNLWSRPSPLTPPRVDAPSPVHGIALPGEETEKPVQAEQAETYVHDLPSISPDPTLNPRRRTKPEKRRNRQLGMVLSVQEERMIREYVSELDIGISEWLRSVAFKAMGKKVPSRK